MVTGIGSPRNKANKYLSERQLFQQKLESITDRSKIRKSGRDFKLSKIDVNIS